MDIQVGDRIRLKKSHPCGSSEWEVLRTGMDFRLKCMGCGHLILIPRKLAEKNIRRLMRGEEEISLSSLRLSGKKDCPAG